MLFKVFNCWSEKLQIDRMNKYLSNQFKKLSWWKSLKFDSPTRSVKMQVHCLDGSQLIESLWWKSPTQTIRWSITCFCLLVFLTLNFKFIFQIYYFVIWTCFSDMQSGICPSCFTNVHFWTKIKSLNVVKCRSGLEVL